MRSFSMVAYFSVIHQHAEAMKWPLKTLLQFYLVACNIFLVHPVYGLEPYKVYERM